MDSIQTDEKMFANFKRNNPDIPVCRLHINLLQEDPGEYFERLAGAVGYFGSLATARLNKEMGHA